MSFIKPVFLFFQNTNYNSKIHQKSPVPPPVQAESEMSDRCFEFFDDYECDKCYYLTPESPAYFQPSQISNVLSQLC